jgi:hypothetical protein
MKRPTNELPVPETEGTGVPGFRTWRGVYLFVLGCFIVYIVLLTVLTRTFS